MAAIRSIPLEIDETTFRKAIIEGELANVRKFTDAGKKNMTCLFSHALRDELVNCPPLSLAIAYNQEEVFNFLLEQLDYKSFMYDQKGSPLYIAIDKLRRGDNWALKYVVRLLTKKVLIAPDLRKIIRNYVIDNANPLSEQFTLLKEFDEYSYDTFDSDIRLAQLQQAIGDFTPALERLKKAYIKEPSAGKRLQLLERVDQIKTQIPATDRSSLLLVQEIHQLALLDEIESPKQALVILKKIKLFENESKLATTSFLQAASPLIENGCSNYDAYMQILNSLVAVEAKMEGATQVLTTQTHVLGIFYVARIRSNYKHQGINLLDHPITKLFYDGLSAFYGWDRPINRNEAINIFEKVISHPNGDTRFPLQTAAYMHIFLGYASFAPDSTLRTESLSVYLNLSKKTLSHLMQRLDLQVMDLEIIESQLWNLLSKAVSEQDKLTVVNILQEFFQVLVTKAKSTPEMLSAFFQKLMTNEFVKTNQSALNDIMTYLQGIGFDSHAQTIIKLLEPLLNTHPYLSSLHMTLGYHYGRIEGIEAIKRNIHYFEKVAQLDSKEFKRNDLSRVYRKLGDESLDVKERIAAYLKAFELGDVHAGFDAADVAETDHTEMKTVLSCYEKILKDEPSLTKKVLTKMIDWANRNRWKTPLAQAEFLRVFSLGKAWLSKPENCKACKSLYDDMQSLFAPADSNANAEMIKALFGDVFDEGLKNHKKEMTRTALAQKLASWRDGKPLHVINNLLAELKNHSRDMKPEDFKEFHSTYIDCFKKCIDKMSEMKDSNPLKEIIKKYFNSDSDIHQFKEIADAVYTHLYHVSGENISTRSTNAALLLSCELNRLYEKTPDNPERSHLNMSKTEMLAALMQIADENRRAQYNVATKSFSFSEPYSYTAFNSLYTAYRYLQRKHFHTDDDKLQQQISTRVNCMEYICGKTTHVASILKCNNIVAAHDLLNEYKTAKSNIVCGEYVRAPLYLAARLLLSTKDKEKEVMELYCLTQEEMRAMIDNAKAFLASHANKKLKPSSSKEYRYHLLATWYINLVDQFDPTGKSYPTDDIDAHILKMALGWKQSNISEDVMQGVLTAFKDNEWMQAKIDKGLATPAIKEPSTRAEVKQVAPGAGAASVTAPIKELPKRAEVKQVAPGTGAAASVVKTVLKDAEAAQNTAQPQHHNVFPQLEEKLPIAAPDATASIPAAAVGVAAQAATVTKSNADTLRDPASIESAQAPTGYRDLLITDRVASVYPHISLFQSAPAFESVELKSGESVNDPLNSASPSIETALKDANLFFSRIPVLTESVAPAPEPTPARVPDREEATNLARENDNSVEPVSKAPDRSRLAVVV